ncbi:MAG: tetratricopeptide repeat protein [Melioribacteraceae bacterium]
MKYLIILILLTCSASAESLDVIIQRGFDKATLQDFDGAMVEFQTAYEISPNDPKIIAYIANILMIQGKLDSALVMYNRSIEIYSTFSSAINNRGLIYQKKNEHLKAIADFTLAISYEDFAAFYYNRAISYLALGQKDEACKDWQTAYEYNSNDAYFMILKHCKGKDESNP